MDLIITEFTCKSVSLPSLILHLGFIFFKTLTFPVFFPSSSISEKTVCELLCPTHKEEPTHLTRVGRAGWNT